MPYKIKKQKCTQSSGKKGTYVVSFTDKHGKKHRDCARSKRSARGVIVNIERNKKSFKESVDELVNIILENVIERLIEE